ncbi:homoserine dehydrogenase [Bacillus sp. MRMR6]|uniref:homoserine dehydrogenase n=1 Tax=Bacillus sp. MRMR6 TaxID=1928617 RepID=UPI000952CBCC|nr:homoserine dehydrogenase [Bacillus sp. MRMR6]OLS36798.1 homoserine dehydrogenase [Bacillus sp. MRMR6]
MSVIKVAILGFGTVGEGVYKTIQSHRDELSAVLGKKVEVVAVLVRNKQKSRNIAESVLVTTDFNDILQLPELDVVVEAIVDREPTFTMLKQSIQKGCHIITANKEMFAHHGQELLELAENQHISVGFEATVAGGIPIIQTLRQLLKINRVSEIHGILNGTSNFILTEMREKKQSFKDALLIAQEKGYAEADPTNDVEGLDAFYKTIILSRIAFGVEPEEHNVELEGITAISSEQIVAAEVLGLKFKHVAVIQKTGTKVTAKIKPVLVGTSHPFYHVEGVENAVNVHSDIVGSITLQGPGAGMFPTASAVIEDLVYVCQNQSRKSMVINAPSQSVNLKEQMKEYWFIQGLNKEYKNINLIERIDHETVIIEAAKLEVEKLKGYNLGIHAYPIIGDYVKVRKGLLVI